MFDRDLGRFPVMVEAVRCGAVKKYPPNLEAIVAVHPENKRYNPMPEDILPCLVQVLSDRGITSLTDLRRDIGLRKAEMMTYFVGFTDPHELPISKSITNYGEQAYGMVKKIREKSEASGEALDLSQQLEVALELNGNDLSAAIITLALGTRMMARKSDFRVLPQFQPSEPFILSEEMMLDWKMRIANFGLVGSRDDSSGDTYHFWHGVLAGMSSQDDNGIYNTISGTVMEWVYRKTPAFTEWLRYRLAGNSGYLHQTDTLGLEIGKALKIMLIECEDEVGAG